MCTQTPCRLGRWDNICTKDPDCIFKPQTTPILTQTHRLHPFHSDTDNFKTSSNPYLPDLFNIVKEQKTAIRVIQISDHHRLVLPELDHSTQILVKIYLIIESTKYEATQVREFKRIF